MRKETFPEGTLVHIVQRGTRGTSIVRDEHDRWRFLRLLRYLNDRDAPRNWDRDITPEHIREGFARPESWAEQRPYISIVAYCLMDNHFHLLVQSKTENSIPEFMQRLCTSMAAYYNAKYGEKGSLFQGPYRARIVDSDVYLQYLAAYIQVKNPFERFPQGLLHAVNNFNEAFEWVQSDPYSSLADCIGDRKSVIVDHMLIDELFDRRGFRSFARDVIKGKYRELDVDETDLELD